LIGLLTRSIEGSVDPREAAATLASGSRTVAAAMVQDARAGPGYQGQRNWWSIIDWDGVPSGLVLPVIFTGCARHGLDEGTIYHIGVVPERRGRGLGRLLLGRGTDVLLHHGVWRIMADTAAENAPMIHLFERQGWTRLPPVEVGSRPLPGIPTVR